MSANEVLERFSPTRRAEHLAIMLVFTLLALTGFPQKYYEAGWARSIVHAFGSVELVRLVHRWAGLAFAAATAFHFATVLAYVFQRKGRLGMLPAKKDFSDAVATLRYYLGATEDHPKFDRFDYRQKFEYWGLVMGAVIMVATGFVLYFPVPFARYLPGSLIPAAKVMHSSEGLMALLVVITWHVYNAHLNPEVFPFDTCIFTGKISRERMEKEHPLELARIERDKKGTGG